MKSLIVFMMLFASFVVGESQIYYNHLDIEDIEYGELIQESRDTMHFNRRVQSYRLQGKYLTWMSVGPNHAYWVDTTTNAIDSFPNPYLDAHGFLISDTGFIFIVNAPNWQDSIRHFRVEWYDSSMNLTGYWNSKDHILPIETDSSLVFDQGDGLYNAIHPNWITGEGLLSCRHTSTLYWIRPNNTIRRRIKGSFRAQHAAHFIEPNRIILYDNLGLDSASRVLVVDTFGLIVEELNPGNRKGDFMGNAQRLPNGNTLVAWGGRIGGLGHPDIEIYDPLGNVIHSIDIPDSLFTYQAWINSPLPLLGTDNEKTLHQKWEYFNLQFQPTHSSNLKPLKKYLYRGN